ncbi:MAG: SUF system NifU family Fe-S cluster assembly protein [Gammaproteobacteria bacterium]|nr:SUF system NifU family Fe-S cluster assembly protein [Gammaproteobacteria bacterium]
MSELNELYQQLIIDHGRKPRNFGVLKDATHSKEGFNPLCGDKLTIYLKVVDDIIQAAQFEGEGCAISVASASLLTQALVGKSIAEFETLFQAFHKLVTGGDAMDLADTLDKLVVLAGVAEYPMRVKCATLCWHATQAALHDKQTSVSTE